MVGVVFSIIQQIGEFSAEPTTSDRHPLMHVLIVANGCTLEDGLSGFCLHYHPPYIKDKENPG